MRLFVAVDPSEAVQRSIESEMGGLKALAPKAKWSRPEALHLTLAFLGEVQDDLVPSFAAALEPIGGRHRPFELEVVGSGTFGPPLHPRVLWLGLGGAVPQLAALRTDVVGALLPLGYEEEARAFSPHLTLARSRLPRGEPALALCARQAAATSLGRFPVDELILYRSQPGPSGAQYTALARIPLSG